MTMIQPPVGQTLRIGVTGTRKLTPAQLYFVRPRVEALLRAIAASNARLLLISALAEGADRLVARCALAQHYELVCPLPFPQAVYEDDFAPASRDEFRHLLGEAGDNVLALDGARDDPKNGLYPEARSYEAVGRLIVRNTDLIIAIWTGTPGEGKGGTADTIRYAANFGPPVIWIHATDGMAEPRWIADAHDLLRGTVPRAVDAPLACYLDRLLAKPGVGVSANTGMLHARGRQLGRALLGEKKPPAPIDAYLHEKPDPTWGPWWVHAWLMRILGGEISRRDRSEDAQEPVARRWIDRARPTGERARECEARYRSSYVWVFLPRRCRAILRCRRAWIRQRSSGQIQCVGGRIGGTVADRRAGCGQRPAWVAPTLH